MLDLIDLSEWKTKEVILKELKAKGFKTDERTWRSQVEKYNENFYNHETDLFLAHSSKGYKLTSNVEEIKESIKDLHKRALDMLIKESKVKKAIGENYNLKMEINDNGIYVIGGIN